MAASIDPLTRTTPVALSAEEALKRSLKELADMKFALDESAIVASTDQRGIINYARQVLRHLEIFA
jgi:hypothetical protein